MISQTKRPRDDDDLSALSFKSNLFSDILTPPSDNKRFKDRTLGMAVDSTQQSSTQQSLSSPPPSPFTSQPTMEQPFRNEISSAESDDVDEYQLLDKPPYGLSQDKYYTAIPLDLPQHVRMTQLLIWSAHDAVKQNARRSASIEERRADQRAAAIQARFIRELREGKIVTSWYTRLPGPSAAVAKKAPNPRNEANRRRIQDFKPALKSLYEEEREWREVSTQLFADHAAMLDAAASDKIPTAITLDLLDGLDDHEKAFVEKYCQGYDEPAIHERIDLEEMEAEVTDLRQKLAVVSQFQRGAERYCKDTMADIARAVERETCLPSDRAKYAHIVDEDAAIREANKETARSILQALANLNSNKSP